MPTSGFLRKQRHTQANVLNYNRRSQDIAHVTRQNFVDSDEDDEDYICSEREDISTGSESYGDSADDDTGDIYDGKDGM